MPPESSSEEGRANPSQENVTPMNTEVPQGNTSKKKRHKRKQPSGHTPSRGREAKKPRTLYQQANPNPHDGADPAHPEGRHHLTGIYHI